MQGPNYIEQIVLHSFAQAKETCTIPWVLSYANPIPSINFRLHHLLMILGGVAGIINITIALVLIVQHLRNWTKPREQKQCIRIIFVLIFMTAITFCSLVWYNASGFLDPIGQYYEGFAIVAMYLLFCTFIVDEHPTNPVKYQAVKHEIKASEAREPKWLARSWIFVFQILMTRVATVVAAAVLYGTQCPLSKARTIGQLVVTAVQSFSTGIAVVSVIRFEQRTRQRHLQGHNSTFKLISFKGVVGLQAIQEIIFRALGETKVFHPKPPFHISYDDFTKGFPDVILLWEFTVMALCFLSAFNATEYHLEKQQGAPALRNPILAFLSCFTPLDFGLAFVSYWSHDKSNAAHEEVDGKASTAIA